MYKQVTAKQFKISFLIAINKNIKIKEYCHVYLLRDYKKMKCYLSHDRKSGYCIKDDSEIVCLFSLIKGRGKQLLNCAINCGGAKLDCFDGYLTDFYKSSGFKEVRREANWNSYGPDVIYMEL